MNHLEKKKRYEAVRQRFGSTALAWEKHQVVIISYIELVNIANSVSFDPELEYLITQGMTLNMSDFEGIGWILTVDRLTRDRLAKI